MSDLGAWDAVWQVLPKDAAGNAHLGDVMSTDSRNTLVHATSRLVSMVGVDDLVIIETPDAVLVAHRAEHWVVVKGTAEITCGDKVVLLSENQSTYIPLGEDDIVRFEDSYGRSN